VIRIEKRWAYVASGESGAGKEQKFKILSETEEDSDPGSK
jgi:hypothetical protein